jgi:hypothetical protein
MNRKPPPEIDAVKQRLRYDPETGHFYWLDGRDVGHRAGTVQHNGYRAIMFNRRLLLEHRLVFAFVYGEWPPLNVDHINGDRADNRIANLRCSTKSENSRNSKTWRTSECGLKGVSRADSKTEKWMARIKHNGKRVYLGVFDTPEEAHAAYVAAVQVFYGEYARAE